MRSAGDEVSYKESMSRTNLPMCEGEVESQPISPSMLESLVGYSYPMMTRARPVLPHVC